MTLQKSPFLSLPILLLGLTGYAGDASRLVGVWRMVDTKNLSTGKVVVQDQYLGYFFAAEKHYCRMVSATDRKRIDKPHQERTREELLDMVATNRFVANCGTYEATDEKFTFRVLVAKNPVVEGREGTFEVHFEGDTLVMRSSTSETLYTRIE